MGDRLKSLVRSLLDKAGIRVFRTGSRYAEDGLVTIHNDHFRRTPEFEAAYARGLKAANGVDPNFAWRVHVALWAAQASLCTPGDFVECGVNAGFMSSAIMQRLRWNTTGRRFHLVDTFEGPPLAQYDPAETKSGRRQLAEQGLAAGAFVTDLERVRANFAEWPEAVIVQGAVPDILPAVAATRVAFLHIDMNSALPERAALEFFWERLSPGAFVLLDDYAYHGYEHQANAMDAAAAAKGAEILSLPTGQGLIVR